MKTKVGEDKNVLKRKLTDLEQEWEGVCQMSVARQQKLEDALKKVCHIFWSENILMKLFFSHRCDSLSHRFSH